MTKQYVSAAGRGLPSHPAIFLAITPEIRRALELLAEASIALLDEIDAPVDGLEADEDFEPIGEDDEENGDHEPNFGWTIDGKVIGADDDREPDLGWTSDGDPSGDDADEDLVAAESSGGFPARIATDHATITEAKSRFDPRLGLRREPPQREWTEHPNGLRFAPGARIDAMIPPFPHEPPGRAQFYVCEEIRRLNAALWSGRRRRSRGYRK
jgi:hypothetical protein